MGASSLLDILGGNRVDPEVVRVLRILHEDQARLLGRELLVLLGGGMPLHVSLVSVQQVQYGSVTRSQGSTLQLLCRVEELGTDAMWILPAPMVLAVADLMQGGNGQSVGEQELTEIDVRLARRLAERLVDTWRIAWQPAMPIQPKLVGESRNLFGGIASPDDDVLAVTLSIQSEGWPPEGSDRAVLCVPLESLGPHLSALTRASVRHGGAAAGPRGHDGERIAETVPLTLEARLPVLSLAAMEVTALRAGLVLHLAGPPDLAMVLVGGEPVFRCRVRQVDRPDGGGNIILTGWEEARAALGEDVGGVSTATVSGSLENRVKVDVTAVLGTTRLTLRELRELTQDSEIVLDQDVSEPIRILAGGVPVAEGRVVGVGDKVGVRVTRLLTDPIPDSNAEPESDSAPEPVQDTTEDAGG